MPTGLDYHDWLRAVQEGRIAIEPEDAHLIWKFVAAARSMAMIRPGPLATLEQCQICLAPFSFFNATPLRDSRGNGILVLSHGLLDGIMTQLQLGYFLQSLPASLNAVYPLADFPETSAKGWITTLLVRSVYDHCASGAPLPNLGYLIPQELDLSIGVGIFSGVIWSLLHELGHLELGHVDGAIPSIHEPSPEDFVVSDELRPYQQAELAADRFAFDCFERKAQENYLIFIFGALAPQDAFESFLVRRSDSHPLTVNRLTRAHRLTLGASGADNYSEFLVRWQKQAGSFLNTEKNYLELDQHGVAPLLTKITRKEIAALFEQISAQARLPGLNLSAVFEPTPRRWHDYAEQLIASWLRSPQS